jgi:hypothetical protein
VARSRSNDRQALPAHGRRPAEHTIRYGFSSSRRWLNFGPMENPNSGVKPKAVGTAGIAKVPIGMYDPGTKITK